ncbi:isocitrate lyase/phosphoenolpyruvate mutase family protein [Halobellus sp. GM3]|uniref:isocitrate lyase/phosphoenolpyruvate mutase family protein n=1 Tax=Halobellus sp. GM3 TaxID=3458410 RepID=UPI00403D9066
MRAEQLRELLKADEPLVVPSVFDVLSARIAESQGFEAVYLSGNNAGASTGATEPMVTLTEMCGRSREIAHNVDAPLIADAGAGFGNAAHTYRTVQEFAQTGLGGIHIEDQVYPKRIHYHDNHHAIVGVERMQQKLRAAVRAREDCRDDVVVMARTDAGRGNLRTEDGQTVEEAVERINAYGDAGAEVGMVFADTTEEIEYAAEHAEIPLAYPLVEMHQQNQDIGPETLGEMGYAMVFYPLSAMLTVTDALTDLYGSLRADGELTLGTDESADLLEQVDTLIGLGEFLEIEDEELERE